METIQRLIFSPRLVLALVATISATLITAMLTEHGALRTAALAGMMTATGGLVLVAFGQLGHALANAIRYYSSRDSGRDS